MADAGTGTACLCLASQLSLTAEGLAVLDRATPIWERAHAAVEAGLGDADLLRAGLAALA